MLVLSRHRDETLMIGEDVRITVVDIRGDKVRLGIDAPDTTPVHRKEVFDAIKRENGGKLLPAPSAPSRPVTVAKPKRSSKPDFEKMALAMHNALNKDAAKSLNEIPEGIRSNLLKMAKAALTA